MNKSVGAIIGGILKNRSVTMPPANFTRPTPHKVREAIFNILINGGLIDLNNKIVLDGFAGSGLMGLEAISRGARLAIFVEKNFSVSKILQQNILKLGLQNQTLIYNSALEDLACHNEQAPDVLFLDPPFTTNFNIHKLLLKLYAKKWLESDTLIVYESPVKSCQPTGLKILKHKTYGTIQIMVGHIDA